MRSLPLVLALAACGPEATLDLPAPPLQPGTQAGPPAGSLPTVRLSPVRNHGARVRVDNAPAGALVYVLVNTDGPGPGLCHPTANVCANLVGNLTVAGALPTDANGSLNQVAPVPPPLRTGRPLWFQIVIIAPGGNSGYALPVELRVIDDEDGDFVINSVDNCPEDANGSQFDDDDDGFGAACDCDDDDAARNPAATDVAGNGIDEDCSGLDAGVTALDLAGTYSGDADLAIAGELFNLESFGLDALPCSGTVTVTVDPAATPPISGSGACITNLYGIAGPAYPFTLTSDSFGFRPTGDLNFLGGIDGWTGIFTIEGASYALTIEPDFNVYGLELSGTMELTLP